MSYQNWSVKERKQLARRVANTVWQGAPSKGDLGRARKCVESVMDDGYKNSVMICRKAVDKLRAGWRPLKKRKP